MRLISLFSLLLCLLSPVNVFAGLFGITPVSFKFTAAHHIAVLRISNDGKEPVLMQAEMKRWTQKNGIDIYKNTQDIIVTPPIFTVAPKSEQIVRMGLRVAPDANVVKAYRLYFTEVLPDVTASRHKKRKALLRFNVKMGVPIMVMPLKPTTTQFNWALNQTNATHLQLSLNNSGTAHVVVLNMNLNFADSQKPLANYQNVKCVLPDNTYKWHITLKKPMDLHGKKIQLVANVNGKKTPFELVVEKK